MQIASFTDSIADTRIRYQVIYMRDSLFVWAQPAPSSGASGSLPSLSLSMPGAASPSGPLPPAATVLPGPAAVRSQGVAAKLAKRYNIPVYACVDLAAADDVLAHVVVKRLIREIDASGRGPRGA